jgi:site-specific DNA-adenine methylase
MNVKKYYELRDKFNSIPRNTLERACLFLIMNKFAFNGVCRYNKKGIFNVPYSNHKHMSVPNLMSIRNKFANKKLLFIFVLPFEKEVGSMGITEQR